MEEKIFTINLRKRALKTPRWKKTNRAAATIRNFLSRHMKTEPDNIKIGDSINHEIWSRGDQKPPAKIKIKVIKTDDGVVKAEMFGHVFEEEIKEEKPKKEEKKESEKKEEPKHKESKESTNK
ncbi:MAG: 50S ribosomal protein L31e [Candidatus Aenigmarchaeota archaeon]|nr:50S ribosomal protein L31e [Candidatus Aenigmarchaeota archaeon]